MRVVLEADTQAAASRLDGLTRREREVLSLLAHGLTDRAIGESLSLTPRTVETHVRHILGKLELPTGRRHNRRVLAVLTYLGEAPTRERPAEMRAFLPSMEAGSGAAARRRRAGASTATCTCASGGPV
jgi:DNA-binding CsgD family transcriptional regulator